VDGLRATSVQEAPDSLSQDAGSLISTLDDLLSCLATAEKTLNGLD
jgi:hypothetical protein